MQNPIDLILHCCTKMKIKNNNNNDNNNNNNNNNNKLMNYIEIAKQ